MNNKARSFEINGLNV